RGPEMDRLARRNPEPRRKRVVPPVVDVLPVDRMTRGSAHRSISYTATVSAPSITRLVPEMRLATGVEMNPAPFAPSPGVPNLPVGLTLSVELYRSGMLFSMVCQIPPSK